MERAGGPLVGVCDRDDARAFAQHGLSERGNLPVLSTLVLRAIRETFFDPLN
jgi:hypothetical protein